MENMYDVIIVGARCAGSPLAMLLARKGYRVLVVDKAAFPSDTVSTHHIHQPGVARLKRWGLIEKIKATNCPGTTTYKFDVGPFALTGSPPPIDGNRVAYAPRRRILDNILADAATEAGAELRERFIVEELTTENGRVTGIRGRDQNGNTVIEKAKIVVGADGARSFVARAVEAPVYVDRGTFTCNYYSYWSGIPNKTTGLYVRDGRMFVVDPTNDGLTTIVGVFPKTEFDRIRSNVEAEFMREVETHVPSLAMLIRNGKREEKFVGAGVLPNFIRKPYGAGWALVGDAGYHKDPITAQGITDAFRDAESLAGAIDSGFSGNLRLEDALAVYERKRNQAVMPMFEMTCDLARLQPPTTEMQQLFAALRGNQRQTDRFLGVVAGTVPVNEFYSPENIEQILNESFPEALAA
jgi:flavin-dependent dehydrogenase